MARLAIASGLTTSAISNVRQQRSIERNPFRSPIDRIRSPRCATLLSLLMLAAFILLHADRVSAQQAAASINGVISDPTGAVVAAATITLTALDTKVVRTTTSNAAGIYVFVDVPPARYALKVVKEGFTSASQSNFEVFVDQTATYDVHLAVGTKQDTIIVSAQDADLVSSTAELGTVLSERAVTDLPLNGRNFTQLLPLTPGVSPISVAQNAGGGGAFAGNAIGSFTFPAVNGQRNRSNMFLLDGVNDLGSFIGNYNFTPIIDTVQEFKVQSHNDEAEFGQVLGGIVNVVSKAGTNTYHASLWEFVRNQQLDARNFFAATRDPLRQNQFGLAGGGPIWIPEVYKGTNRTFFYGGYEGYRQSQASATPILVPTLKELTGDFNGDGPIIYNPFTTQPDPDKPGSYVRTPFPGNIIPPTLVSPASLEWAKLFPLPGSSTVAGYNLTNTTPEHTNQDSYQMRVDQVFNAHDVLFARISYYTQTQTGQPSLSGGGLPGAIQELNLIGWNGAVHETHSFGPSAVLDLHFARNWGDDQNNQNVLNAPTNFANDLIASGIAPSFISDYRGGAGPYIPTVGISGYASSGQHIQDTRISDSWEFGGDFTKSVGRHTIKMGAQFETNNTRSPLYYSVVNFTSYETSNLESPGGTGNALASFLLGVPDSALRRNVLVTTHGGWVDGAYIQDQWRVSDRLTLNIGLRWDVTLWPIYGTQGTPDSYVGDLNLNNGTYILANVPRACSSTVGFPCIAGGVLPAHVVVTDQQSGAILHNSYDNWQGRFGFAYRLAGKTVLRGSFGRFYDNWNSVIQLAQNYGGTWPDIGQITVNNLNQINPTAGIGDPLNLSSGAVQYPASNPFSQVAYYLNPTGFKLPYSDEWNFDVERSLGGGATLSVAYVGSKSLHLDLGGYQNVAQTPGSGDAAKVASRQPYPYISPTNYDQSIGQSKFDALEVRLEHKFSGGLAYLVNYTWSKSIDVACSGSFGAEGCELQNPYNINADRSVSGFDLPQNFNASWNWEIPFGSGKSHGTGKPFLAYAAANWQLNGILSLYSGVPFDVTVNGDIANTGNILERANLVSKDPYLPNKGPNGWLNPAAFAVPPDYTFGTLGRNSLRTDWTRNLDLSLFRNFPIREKATIQFRAEAFNLTNTAIFGQPSSILNAPNFGTINSTSNSPRQLQFSLKALF
jgi:hypothetical protein